MELKKYMWMDLITDFFKSKGIKLENYKFDIFDDDNYQDIYKDTKKVLVITLDEPLSCDDSQLNGAKKLKIHFDEFHLWCVTTHVFRNFKVFDDEWIIFLKEKHPFQEKYVEIANEYLFTRDAQVYQRQLKELNDEISRCKDLASKYEDKVQKIEEKIVDLANKYNVSFHKNENTYQSTRK